MLQWFVHIGKYYFKILLKIFMQRSIITVVNALSTGQVHNNCNCLSASNFFSCFCHQVAQVILNIESTVRETLCHYQPCAVKKLFSLFVCCLFVLILGALPAESWKEKTHKNNFIGCSTSRELKRGNPVTVNIWCSTSQVLKGENQVTLYFFSFCPKN